MKKKGKNSSPSIAVPKKVPTTKRCTPLRISSGKEQCVGHRQPHPIEPASLNGGFLRNGNNAANGRADPGKK